MFYSPKHAQATTTSITRRRIAGVAVAGATAAVGSVATAQGASASTSSNVWDEVAQCESGGNWQTSTGNGFYGGLQFTNQTWNAFGGGQYGENADDATRSQQIEIAQKVLAEQGPGAWPHCSQVAGLTESNGMTGESSDEAPEEETTEEAPEEERSDEGASRSEDREAPAEEAPEEETTEEAPEEEAPVEEAPEEEAPVEEAPEEEAPVEEAPKGTLNVDGIRGPLTNEAIEKWVGVDADGELSTDDIKALQEKVGTNQDGIIGSKTTTAVQDEVGADEDGIWGPKTTSALQTFLNDQGF